MEMRRILKCTTTKRSKKCLTKIFNKNKKSAENDEDYGELCSKPDLQSEIFILEKEKFLQNLKRTHEEIELLEKNTRLQAESGYWLEERRKILTASNFYYVCVKRKSTKCAPLVKRLLYKTSSMNIPSLKHGKTYEKTAILQLGKQENVKIEENGLFVDHEFCYLGK